LGFWFGCFEPLALLVGGWAVGVSSDPFALVGPSPLPAGHRAIGSVAARR
jgi:hypothetical protein